MAIAESASLFWRLCSAPILVLLFSITAATAGAAVPPETIHDLALGENDAKVNAIGTLVQSGGPDSLMIAIDPTFDL